MNVKLVKIPYSFENQDGEVIEGFSLFIVKDGVKVKLRKDKFTSEDTYNVLFMLADSAEADEQ